MPQKSLLIIALLAICSCNNPHTTAPNNNTKHTAITLREPSKKELNNPLLKYKVETLSNEEVGFLHKLQKENANILIDKKVRRFYRDSDLIYNELIIPKDTLLSEGYVYYQFVYWGSISDINITYKYSQGQASTCYGSIIGSDTNSYIHTYTGYGLSANVTEVYSNGLKMYSKTTPL